MLCVFFVSCSVILCSKARLWLLRICSSSNRISSHNAHTFYLGSLFPVFMKRVKCHSAWIKWDGSLVTPHWCYSCRKKNIRVIDPTLSRLPLSWMRRRIALWQKSTHSAAAVAKSKDHYSSACKRAHFMHARARAHTVALALTVNEQIYEYVCPLFKIISVGRMHFLFCTKTTVFRNE